MINTAIVKVISICVLAAVLFFSASHPSTVEQGAGAFAKTASYEYKDGQLVFNIVFTNNHSTAKKLQFSSGQKMSNSFVALPSTGAHMNSVRGNAAQVILRAIY